MIRRSTALSVLVVLLAACGPRTAATPRDRNFISTEELRSSERPDAYAAVEALRPLWLRSPGPSSIALGRQSVQVYLDDSLMGGLEQLRQIPTHTVSSMRFIDGPDATQRWGMNHGLGAIVVATR